MLAAVSPAAIRRVNGLRRITALRCNCITAGPLWPRFLSSGSDGSGRDGKDHGILEPVREDGASKDESSKTEASGK